MAILNDVIGSSKVTRNHVSQKNIKENMGNFKVRSVHVDGLALLGARISAGTLMSNWGIVYLWRELVLSRSNWCDTMGVIWVLISCSGWFTSIILFRINDEFWNVYLNLKKMNQKLNQMILLFNSRVSLTKIYMCLTYYIPWITMKLSCWPVTNCKWN